MESASKNTIFGLKMIVKSGLERNIFEVPPCASHFLLIHFTSYEGGLLHKITISVTKITFFAHGGISIIFFMKYVFTINETLRHKFHPYSILTG